MDLEIVIGIAIGAAVTAIFWMVTKGISLKKSGGNTVQRIHAVSIDNVCKEIEALIATCNLSSLNVTSLKSDLDQKVASLTELVAQHGEELEFYHRKYVTHLVEDYRRFLRSLDEVSSLFVLHGASLATPVTTANPPVTPEAVFTEPESKFAKLPLAAEPAPEIVLPASPPVEDPNSEPVVFPQDTVRKPFPDPAFTASSEEQASAEIDEQDTNTYVSLDKTATDSGEVVDDFMAAPAKEPPVTPQASVIEDLVESFETAIPDFDPAVAPQYLPPVVSNDTEIIKTQPEHVQEPDTLVTNQSPMITPEQTSDVPLPVTPEDSDSARTTGQDSAETFIFSGATSTPDDDPAPGLFDTDIADISQIAPEKSEIPVFSEPAEAPQAPVVVPPFDSADTAQTTPPANPEIPVANAQEKHEEKSSSKIITGDDLVEKMDSFFEF